MFAKWLSIFVLLLVGVFIHVVCCADYKFPRFPTSKSGASKYFIGQAGESCYQVCMRQTMTCNEHIQTNNSTDIFQQLGIKCTPDLQPWWATNQPSYVSDPSDPYGNYGKCLGYTAVPSGVACGGSYYTVQRLCRCDPPSKTKLTFGTGVSAGSVDQKEQFIFSHVVAPGDYGVMNHFWFTLPNPAGDDLYIKYYVDGETEASIQFYPALACGVGFNDTVAPWGTKWIGKGAHDGGYFFNFRIPFQKTIAITAQHKSGGVGGFYVIVRGATNIPLSFGNVNVPNTARLLLFSVSAWFDPVELVPLAERASGSGAVFMHTLAVTSSSVNFIEGCYRFFTPDYSDFPGLVLSTGTEDYFDSAWTFNAGGYHLPVAGLTHIDGQNGGQPFVHMSAYRFHEEDPLLFAGGFSFMWRNGDVFDASGIKCLTLEGKKVGDPQRTFVQAYTWVYVW